MQASKSAALALIFGFALCSGAVGVQRNTVPLNACGKPIAPALVAPPEEPSDSAAEATPRDEFSPQPAVAFRRRGRAVLDRVGLSEMVNRRGLRRGRGAIRASMSPAATQKSFHLRAVVSNRRLVGTLAMMNFRMIYCRRAILKTALASLIVSLPQYSHAEDAVGLIKGVQGSAFVKRGENQVAATAGADILAKDVALTGDQPSRLQLQFGPKTRVRLGANTVFEVDRFVAGLARAMELDKGAALIEHDPREGPDIILRSPYALLAARGTAFFAGPSNGVFGVFVHSGHVDVQTSAGQVTLAPGEGTDIAEPGAAPTPPKRWRRTRIRVALASVL